MKFGSACVRSEHLGGGLHAGPGRRCISKIAQRRFEMMKIGDDVVRTKITHRPEPDHAARQLGALSGNDRAITVVHVAHYRRAVKPVRETKDGHGGRKWTRGLEHRQAERLAPGLQRGRQAQVPGQHFRQALLLDHGEGFPQRHHQGHRWGERGFTFVERSLRPAEIEIEARHPMADAMTRMALSLAATRMSIPHRSMRISIPPTPLTESTMRRVSVSRSAAPMAATSATTPVALSLCTQITAR